MKTLANHQRLNYQLGLLHFAHLLITVDGFIDDREQSAIQNLQFEEQIPEPILQDFKKMVSHKSERQVYEQGLNYLNHCSDHEKLCALVHLYQLAQADNQIHIKEVRLLLYALKATNVEFEDVQLSARMVNADKKFIAQ